MTKPISKVKNVVLMILNSGFPDVRACQQADALEENGFEVWIVVDSNSGKKTSGIDESKYRTISVPVIEGKAARVRFLLTWDLPSLRRKVFVELETHDLKHRIFAVHVFDLPWSVFAERISKALNARFVIDFKEPWPALHDILKPSSTMEAIIRLVRSSASVRERERSISQRADHIFVVVEENRERLQGFVPGNKVSVVSNTKEFDGLPRNLALNDSKPLNVLYHGTIQDFRGLRTVSRAVATGKLKDFQFTALGFVAGSAEKKWMSEFIAAHKIPNFTLIDWSNDIDYVKSLLAASDIFMIPHERNELTEFTIPNKLFEYFGSGKPVICSDVRPLKRVVEGTGSGVVFAAGDPDDFVEKLLSMKPAEVRKHMAKNAIVAAQNEYNWERDARTLVTAYCNLYACQNSAIQS